MNELKEATFITFAVQITRATSEVGINLLTTGIIFVSIPNIFSTQNGGSGPHNSTVCEQRLLSPIDRNEFQTH